MTGVDHEPLSQLWGVQCSGFLVSDKPTCLTTSKNTLKLEWKFNVFIWSRLVTFSSWNISVSSIKVNPKVRNYPSVVYISSKFQKTLKFFYWNENVSVVKSSGYGKIEIHCNYFCLHTTSKKDLKFWFMKVISFTIQNVINPKMSGRKTEKSSFYHL